MKHIMNPWCFWQHSVRMLLLGHEWKKLAKSGFLNCLACLSSGNKVRFFLPALTSPQAEPRCCLCLASRCYTSQTLKFVLKPTTCYCDCVTVFLAYGIILQLLFSGNSLFPLGISQFTCPKLSICIEESSGD